MPGDWMSVSMTPTRRPPAASNVERLAVTLDFPVPPRKEWTDTIVGMSSSPFSIPVPARRSTEIVAAVDPGSGPDTALPRRRAAPRRVTFATSRPPGTLPTGPRDRGDYGSLGL